MLALLQDQLGDGRAPVRLRLSLMRHGLAERARESDPFTVAGTAPRGGGEARSLWLWRGPRSLVGGAGFSRLSGDHGHVVTPYIGFFPLPSTTFNATAATQTVPG